MDRRTILFVLLVGATFFGLNLFFSYQRDEQNRQLITEGEAKQEKELVAKREAVAKRIEARSSLPLAKVTLEDGREIDGVVVDGGFLTLAWAEELPKSVAMEGKTLQLATGESVRGGPVLYAGEEFKRLEIAALPDMGAFDVQLITFPETVIFLGEYRDANLSFPADRPKVNGLVMYKTTQGYLPLGFYEARGNLLVELQNVPALTDLVAAKAPVVPSALESREKYYVLENATQQLVFSNVGGALAEINLPLRSDENEVSVVNPIGFDREIEKDSPANAHFPGHPYYKAGSTEENPPGPIGGYYPLTRRGIKGKAPLAPQFFPLNLVSDYPEMAQLVYQMKEFTDQKIVFEAAQSHRKITKTYTLSKEGAPYVFDLELKVEGDSRGLYLTSGVPEVEIMSNTSNPRIQYRVKRKNKSEVEKISLPKPKEGVNVSSVYPDWVVNSNGYLGIIMDPLTEIGPGYRATASSGTVVPTRLSLVDPKYTPYPASKYPGYQVFLPIPSQGGTYSFRIYAGPFEEATLKKVDKIYRDPSTGYDPDYRACKTFYGWFAFISKPFAKVLFAVMSFFHTITNSWGFSIILLTVFLRLLLYPLNAWSIKSMRRMQEISPQVQAIQKRHKKDPKKGQIEIMNLYRKEKVNPFTGCIPILIQLPFLIAMFDLLKSSFQLRGASFIPGWIDNLTAPDVLFSWDRPLFFIGNQFHLLPVLLGAVMFLQQRMTAGKVNKAEMTDQQRQQRAMGTVMTVVFTVMFYHFPSGLNIYWLSSMTLGIGQQWFTNRLLDKKKKKGKVEILPKKRA